MTVRLSKKEIETIRKTVREKLPQAEVYLFGSRADEGQKGGDIDLLILTDEPVNFQDQTRIHWRLLEELGEQKIDIVYQRRGHLTTFGVLAMETAVLL